jgi:hypothetical protein
MINVTSFLLGLNLSLLITPKAKSGSGFLFSTRLRIRCSIVKEILTNLWSKFLLGGKLITFRQLGHKMDTGLTKEYEAANLFFK